MEAKPWKQGAILDGPMGLNHYIAGSIFNLMIRFCKFLLPGLLIILTTTNLWAQTKEYETLKIGPQPLQQKGMATLQYKPTEALQKSIEGEPLIAVLTYLTKGEATATEVPLQAGKKGLWTAKITLPESADLLVLSFIRSTETDNNNGNGYFFSIADASGTVPAGNAASLSQVYNANFATGVQNRQADLAVKYAKTFLENGASQLNVYQKASWMMNAKDTLALCGHLQSLGNEAISEDDYFTLANMAMRICKDAALQKAIQEKHYAAHPKGVWRLRTWADSINRAPNVVAMYAWYNAFKLAHPEQDTVARKYITRFLPNLMYYAAQRYDVSMLKALDKDPDTKQLSAYEVAGYYNFFSTQCLAKDTLQADAIAFIQKAMDAVAPLYASQATKAAYQSETMYKRNLDRSMRTYEGTYGQWLLKQNRLDSAIYYLDRAAAYKKWKDETLNEALAKAYLQNKTPAQALELVEKAILADAATAQLKTLYLEAAAQAQLANPSAQLEALEKTAFEVKTAEFRKKMINQPAPAFALKDMEGNEVSLAALKGKVVVIDFWATWCGPCIASFPGMQQVVDAHKNNSDVVLLFVNSWENGDKTGNVKKFLTGKPYTFEVLFDLDDKVITQYDVQGIPTKFIIDKQGNIAFKSVGYNGSTEKTFSEMQLMLELAARR